jgi:virginiamycin B lyase
MAQQAEKETTKHEQMKREAEVPGKPEVEEPSKPRAEKPAPQGVGTQTRSRVHGQAQPYTPGAGTTAGKTDQGRGRDPQAESPPVSSTAPEVGKGPFSKRFNRRILFIIAAIVAAGVLFLTVVLPRFQNPPIERRASELPEITVEHPAGIAVSADAIWVGSFGRRLVSRIDPESNSVVATIETVSVPRVVVADENAVWAAHEDPDASGDMLVSRINPANNRVVAKVKVKGSWSGIAAGAGAVWILSEKGDTLSRIDPKTNRVATTKLGGGDIKRLAADTGSVWVTDTEDDTVSRIDPATNRVANRIKVGRTPQAITVGAGSVWVSNTGDDTVSRIDPASNRVVKTIGVKQESPAYGNMAADPRSVWTVGTINDSNRIYRTDIASGRLVEIYRFAGDPVAIAATDRVVWVTVAPGGAVYRIDQ